MKWRLKPTKTQRTKGLMSGLLMKEAGKFGYFLVTEIVKKIGFSMRYVRGESFGAPGGLSGGWLA